MKCKHCNGTGATNWYVNRAFVTCPYCGGTGEVDSEQTNEEWFCQLPTEEKAEWLIEFAIMCIPCELTVLSKKIKTYKNNILEWLKEAHNG